MILQDVRFIGVFTAFSIIIFAFLFMAYKILHRDKKRLNIIFTGFFFSVSIGLILNLIYYPLRDKTVVTVLNTGTNAFVIFGIIFLVVMELIILKSEKVITPNKQILIILIYGALDSVLFIFLAIPGWGVTINDSTDWRPLWSLPYFIYAITIFGIAVILMLYYSVLIDKQFKEPQLKRRWKFFQLGLVLLLCFTYGVFISNYLDILIIRNIVSLLGILLAVVGGYLIYYGVGRQLEK